MPSAYISKYVYSVVNPSPATKKNQVRVFVKDSNNYMTCIVIFVKNIFLYTYWLLIINLYNYLMIQYIQSERSAASGGEKTYNLKWSFIYDKQLDAKLRGTKFM